MRRREIGPAALPRDSRLVRNTSTLQMREFWQRAERSAAEFETWPEAKRAVLSIASMRSEPRSRIWRRDLGGVQCSTVRN